MLRDERNLKRMITIRDRRRNLKSECESPISCRVSVSDNVVVKQKVSSTAITKYFFLVIRITSFLPRLKLTRLEDAYLSCGTFLQ